MVINTTLRERSEQSWKLLSLIRTRVCKSYLKGNCNIEETGWSLEKSLDASTTSASVFSIFLEEKDTSTMSTSMSSKIVDSEGKDASMSRSKSMSSRTIDSEGKRSIVGVGKFSGCDSGAL